MGSLLRALRAYTAVTTPTGTGLVLAQLRNKVTVLESGVVRVLERHEVCEIEFDVEWDVVLEAV